MFLRFGCAGLLWCAVSAIVWITGVDEARRLRIFENPKSGEASKLIGGPGGAGGSENDALEPPGQHYLNDMQLWRKIWRCKPLLAICAAHFAQNWTQYTLSIWLPTYLHEVLGMEERTLWLSALPYLVSAISGVMWGMFADLLILRKYFDLLTIRRMATSIGLLGPAVCSVAFAAATSPASALAVVTLSALLGAATSSGYMANHADISSGYAGLTFGVANTIATIPGIVAGPLTAWVVSENGGIWKVVFIVAAGINCLSTCIYLAFSKAEPVL